MSRRRLRIVAAIALLATSTTAIAWLPSLVAVPVTIDGPLFGRSFVVWFVALAAIAGASFLALATFAGRAQHRGEALFAGPPLLAIALALRLFAAVAPPWLSDDLWRYLWEGRVERAGFSPYVYPPDAPELAEVRGEASGLGTADDEASGRDLHARVAHRDIPAVYPPAAQLLFRVVPESVTLWKLLVAAADFAVAIGLVRVLRRTRRPIATALFHAWNPLVVLEAAGSGHVDAIAWSLLMLALLWHGPARGGELVRGALAGLAGMVKPQAFVLCVAFAVQRRWRALTSAVVMALLVWLPFAGDGSALFNGLGRYAHDWEFNGLAYPPLVRVAEWLKGWLEALPSQPLDLWRVREIGYAIVPNQLGRKLALLLFAWIAWRLARCLRTRPRLLCFALLAAFIATAPAAHPWYIAWLAPFLPLLAPRLARAPLLLTTTTLLAGSVKAASLVSGEWVEPPWVALVTWVAPCVIFALDVWRLPPSALDEAESA